MVKILSFACVLLGATLVLPKSMEAAAPGAPEGITLVCEAAIVAIAREPNQAALIRADTAAAIQRILDLKGRGFGLDKARSLGRINAVFLENVVRQPTARTDMELIRDLCEEAVISGRLDPM